MQPLHGSEVYFNNNSKRHLTLHGLTDSMSLTCFPPTTGMSNDFYMNKHRGHLDMMELPTHTCDGGRGVWTCLGGNLRATREATGAQAHHCRNGIDFVFDHSRSRKQVRNTSQPSRRLAKGCWEGITLSMT